MTEVWRVGPLMIQSNLMVLLIGSVIGYLIMKWRLTTTAYYQSNILDVLTNSLLILILIWRFGYLLFNPSIIWNEPGLILAASGSDRELWTGIIVSSIYVIWQIKKANIHYYVVLDLLPYGVLTVLIINSTINWQYGLPTRLPWGISIANPNFKYHPIHLYMILLSAPLLIALWRKSKEIGQGKIFRTFSIVFGIGMMLVSLFKPQSPYLLGLSSEQLIYMSFLIAGSILLIIAKGQGEKECLQKDTNKIPNPFNRTWKSS